MSSETISYDIDVELPPNYAGRLFDFIYQKYLLAQKRRFANISRSSEGGGEQTLSYTVLDEAGNGNLRVDIRGTNELKVNIAPLRGAVNEQTVDEAKQDITIAIDFFEEQVRQNSLYFAWREGEAVLPEKVSGKERKSINRLFLETQVLLFVLFITLGLFLFLILPSIYLVPIVLIGIQLIFVFFSNKFIARTADWHITEEDPYIHILEYRLPLERHEEFKKMFSGQKLADLKKEVYQETIAEKGEIDCATTQRIFAKYGFECNPESFVSRKVNVYELVKKTADKFHLPTPEIVVTNTLLPNAAASGPSPNRGIVMITTGLFVNLTEEEIFSVLGHEFGHMKGRDPLILYGLTSAQYLFTFFVVFYYLPWLFTSPILFLIYFWLALTIVYFIAKFFEFRADLTSAIVIGEPKILAEALEKIGFRRLLFERVPSFRVQEWISLDPHPPIYFRTEKLKQLVDPREIKHAFIKSARDVTKGFLDSF